MSPQKDFYIFSPKTATHSFQIFENFDRFEDIVEQIRHSCENETFTRYFCMPNLLAKALNAQTEHGRFISQLHLTAGIRKPSTAWPDRTHQYRQMDA